MSTPQQSDIAKKIVLIGDSGVGKTCIISRFVSGDYNKNMNSTDGASYATKKLVLPKLKTSINLDIWDTAGQERYKSLTKFFYKDAAMIIMVYDVTLKTSFDNLKEYWYREVQELSEKNFVLGIAGNKSDLYEREQVSEKEAREYAKSINAVFGLTSAQNNTGIDQLFEDIGMKFLEPNFQEKMEENNKGKNMETSIKLNKKKIKKHDKEHKKKKFC
jgi:small GTP-binding protein